MRRPAVTAVTAVAAAGLVLAYGWWRMPGGTGGGALGGGRHVPPAASSSDVGPSGNREIMQGRGYAQHTHIVATTFWVGEVFDPSASDGSQVLSTYDAKWMEHYGGCDGVVRNGVCTTEPRTAANGYFPTAMNPKQNPFYLDLPFDDINNAIARAQRAEVIPWANRPGYAERAADSGFSYMKNRWVKLSRSERTCYGQIQDAGPGRYDDAAYVFGSDDRRPANRKFNGAGLDVSPALNGCLGFQQLNGDSDTVDWSFVDDIDVPDGPWRTIVTTQQVVN